MTIAFLPNVINLRLGAALLLLSGSIAVRGADSESALRESNASLRHEVQRAIDSEAWPGCKRAKIGRGFGLPRIIQP